MTMRQPGAWDDEPTDVEQPFGPGAGAPLTRGPITDVMSTTPGKRITPEMAARIARVRAAALAEAQAAARADADAIASARQQDALAAARTAALAEARAARERALAADGAPAADADTDLAAVPLR